MEVIVKECWSLSPHEGAAAFGSFERSPLPRALPAKDLTGGRTQKLNVRQHRRIHCGPGTSDEDSAQESIVDTENYLQWNRERDDPNHGEAQP